MIPEFSRLRSRLLLPAVLLAIVSVALSGVALAVVLLVPGKTKPVAIGLLVAAVVLACILVLLELRALARLQRELLQPSTELAAAVTRALLAENPAPMPSSRGWAPPLRTISSGINDLVRHIGDARRMNEEVSDSVRRRDEVAVKAAEVAHEEEIKGQTDSLTGVFNRRKLDIDLAGIIDRMRGTPERFSYVMIDVDHFKLFNDTYGHQAGDQLLAGLGRLLNSMLRSNRDKAYRYGGEEFSLILPGTTAATAAPVLDRLRVAITQTLSLPDRHVSASFGVSAWPDHGSTPEEIIRAADGALYSAKTAGRDRVVVAVTGLAATD